LSWSWIPIVGPDIRFIKYPADAQIVTLNNLSVFSSGTSEDSIGITFQVDIEFTYLLIKDEIGTLHRELATTYHATIVSKAKEAIRNEAGNVPYEDYYENRRDVEARLRAAVEARWSEQPPLPCVLDQFYLGHIKVAPSVAEKQLESRIQNEKNLMEGYTQQARIERELTDVDINNIYLQETNLLRNTEAQVSLTIAKAKLEAEKKLALANREGISKLIQAVELTQQDHIASFMYIRTLKNHKNATFDVSYLSSENVLRTTSVL